ncbi:MAG: hypothetical protein WAK33_14470 [Silvibacterium sp.]
MPSSRKKAIARKFTHDWVAGYLSFAGFSPGSFVRNGAFELLALDGKVISLSLQSIKWVCFVRDFNSGEPSNPERLLRKTFAGRPRSEGLFLRAKLTDGDLIEGIAANDLSLISGEGIFLTPPDIRSNTQRLWIPATSLVELEVVAVIGRSAKKKSTPATLEDRQESLF